jgi:hypothetical protein
VDPSFVTITGVVRVTHVTVSLPATVVAASKSYSLTATYRSPSSP